MLKKILTPLFYKRNDILTQKSMSQNKDSPFQERAFCSLTEHCSYFAYFDVDL